MKKIKVENICLHDKFTDHNKIKETLLNLISKAENTELYEVLENKTTMSINKCDWSISSDQNRKWVNFFAPYLRDNFDRFFKELGFLNNYIIKNLWFQQYVPGDKHGWHVHADNYTGVYYLNFDGVDKTQLINPYDKAVIDIEAKEGDLIIFPSSVVHRCPTVSANKTIISFNVEIQGFTKELKEYLKER
jgi:hypothetical protein